MGGFLFRLGLPRWHSLPFPLFDSSILLYIFLDGELRKTIVRSVAATDDGDGTTKL